MKKIVIVAVCLIVVILISVPVVSSFAGNNNLPRQLELGNKYLLEGNYEEAVLAFEKAIKIDPRNIDAHMGLSKAYIGLDKLEEAKDPLYVVIDIEDTHIEAYLLLAEILEELEEIEEAYRVLDAGIQAAHEPKLYLVLADLKLRQGDLEEAMLILEAGIARTGSSILQSRLDEIRPTAPIAIENETDTFYLELESSVAGWMVYYTTDGTDPVTNGIAYQQAISIEEGETTIKAVSISGRGAVSDIFEYVYILQPEDMLSDPDQVYIKRGNSRGNTVNGGLVVQQEDWVVHLGMVAYYHSVEPWSFSLFRTSKDLTVTQPLDIDSGIIGHLNSYSNKLYYVRNYQLYVAEADGSQAKLLADHVYGDVNIIDDTVYFIQYNNEAAADEEYFNGPLQRINLDGSSRASMTSASTHSVNVVDDLVYFLDLDQRGRLYTIHIDGSNLHAFDQISAGMVIVENDWIYFNNHHDNLRLYRIRVDGNQLEKITDDSVRTFNVHDDSIFYTASNENNSLYHIYVDGTSRRQLLNERIWQINIVADHIYYMAEERIGMIPLDNLSSDQTIPDPSLLYPNLHLPGGAVVVHYDQSSNSLDIRQNIRLDLRQNIQDAFQVWNSPINLIEDKSEFASCLAIAGDIYNIEIAVVVLNTEYYPFTAYQMSKLGNKLLILDHFKVHSAYALVITYEDRFGNSYEISLTSSDTYNPAFFTVYSSETILPLP